MARRIAAVLIAATVIAAMSGCGALLESERFSAQAFVEDGLEGEVPTGTEISNFYELKGVVKRMVENRQETGELTFSSYSGDVRGDLARACEEVKYETAIGAYSVEYMSHDPRQIVSYYKASLNITYKRSKDEIDSIIPLSGGADALSEELYRTLNAGRRLLTVKLFSGTIDSETIAGLISGIYYENPLNIVVLPDITVNSYPDSGIERIIEIILDYREPEVDLLLMKREIGIKAKELADSIGDSDRAHISLGILERLSEKVSVIPPGANGTEGGQVLPPDKNTAFDALVDQSSGAEGIAMAFKAVSKLKELPAIVVIGKLDRQPHAWNIVEIDGEYYHIDVSRVKQEGIYDVFLKSDADMTGSYYWDVGQYPQCAGSLTYYDIVGWPEESDSPLTQ